MKAAWPDTILSGQADLSSEMAGRTGLSEGKIQSGFWPGTQTKEYRSSCCATKRLFPSRLLRRVIILPGTTRRGGLSGVDQGDRNRYDLADGTAASPDLNW